VHHRGVRAVLHETPGPVVLADPEDLPQRNAESFAEDHPIGPAVRHDRDALAPVPRHHRGEHREGSAPQLLETFPLGTDERRGIGEPEPDNLRLAGLHLVERPPLPAPESHLAERRQEDGADTPGGGQRRRRGPRPRQVARIHRVDGRVAQRARQRLGLPAAHIREPDIGVAEEARLSRPLDLAVTDQVDPGRLAQISAPDAPQWRPQFRSR